MILVWNGWGILTPIIAVATLCGVQSLADTMGGDGYYEANILPKLTACLLAGALVGFVGYLLNRGTANLDAKHRFFWIPMEYWSAIIVVFGFFASIAK